MADRIVLKTISLADFPFLGAEVPENSDESIRELLERPYRIVYRILQDRMDVAAVIHGARRLPRIPPS